MATARKAPAKRAASGSSAASDGKTVRRAPVGRSKVLKPSAKAAHDGVDTAKPKTAARKRVVNGAAHDDTTASAVTTNGAARTKKRVAPKVSRKDALGVPDLSLDGDGLAELRDQLAEGELDRVEAELERAVLAQVGLPGDPELLALGLGGSFPAVPEGVLELVDGEPLAVLEDVPVVDRDRVVDLAAEEHRSARRGLLPEHVAPAPVLWAEDEAVVARVR